MPVTIRIMKKQTGHSRFQFDLSGGALCLDFANTVSQRHIPGKTCDHLAGYSDLLAFATQSRYLPAEFAGKLADATEEYAQASSRALETAHKLRESIYRTFVACVTGRPGAADDLKLIQNMTVEGWKHSWLTKIGPI